MSRDRRPGRAPSEFFRAPIPVVGGGPTRGVGRDVRAGRPAPVAGTAEQPAPNGAPPAVPPAPADADGVADEDVDGSEDIDDSDMEEVDGEAEATAEAAEDAAPLTASSASLPQAVAARAMPAASAAVRVQRRRFTMFLSGQRPGCPAAARPACGRGPRWGAVRQAWPDPTSRRTSVPLSRPSWPWAASIASWSPWLCAAASSAGVTGSTRSSK